MKIGTQGEGLSQQYLREKGYHILHTNYRTRFGEIDIVALYEKTLVFAEVKTRQSMKYGLPREAVNYKKQQNYYRLAEHYIKYFTGCYESVRFDVIEVYKNGNQFNIEHIENAF
ncbi:YraN family protein [Alkaliphilus crotonatoxidans]